MGKRHFNWLVYGLISLVLGGCFQGNLSSVPHEADADIIALYGSLTPHSVNNVDNVNQVTPSPTAIIISPTPSEAPTHAPIIADDGTIIHIVAAGDTLFEIAQRYEVSMEALAAVNNISDSSQIFVEQALIIPNATILPRIPPVTDTPTLTPSVTAIFPTATDTPVFTDTPSASNTALFTETPTASDTATWTETPTASDTAILTETPIPTDTATFTSVPTATDSPIASPVLIATDIPIPSETASIIPSATERDIPTETPLPSATVDENQVIHLVQAGENLYQISIQYSVSLDALAAANGISDTGNVLVGQELIIPISTPMIIVQEATRTVSSDAIIPTHTPVAIAPPTNVNGIPVEQIFDLSPEVIDHMLNIYQQGQAMGRNPRAFSKLGDSTIENPHFLARFDDHTRGAYNLGDYIYLQSVIDYYAGSFERQGVAVRRGMHSWTVFDPQWADKSQCQPRESPLACEIRLHNPSVLLIRLGSNDVGVPQSFEDNMREILDYTMASGVIPILGTKADRNDGYGNPNNLIIRKLAEEYQLPLWDFDLVANTLASRGLTEDAVHMSFNFSHDYTDPHTFVTGHGVHNLTALIVLDKIWRIVTPSVG